MQISAIILAGGKSTRMGIDKALIQINGISLLERSINICLPICKQIFISSGNPSHEKFGFKIIPDKKENCGPLGGIYSCLKQSETDWNFVISVDAAFVESEFVSFIISEIGGFDAVVPFHDNGKEPLVAMYHKSGLSTMKKMLDSGNFKMHKLLNSMNTQYINSQYWVEKFPEIFRNLNCPEDI